MTREEQIERAIDENWSSLIENEDPEIAFRNGIKWADSHPNWHKYPGEIPPLKQRILICTTKGRILETVWCQPMLISGKAYGEPTFEDNRYNKDNVIAWMEKPELPKFQ